MGDAKAENMLMAAPKPVKKIPVLEEMKLDKIMLSPYTQMWNSIKTEYSDLTPQNKTKKDSDEDKSSISQNLNDT